MNTTITFYFNEVRFTLLHRRLIKENIINVFRRNNRIAEHISFIFCTDEFLLKVNQDYLSHDYYTDIITFDLSDGKGIKGEIYISVDRVRENAEKLNSPFILEMYRVMFHGILHLCGMKDKTAAQKKLMRAEEDKCIRKLNVVGHKTQQRRT